MVARTWLSVTVELLGGRGEQLWPWPGRVFAVGPSHTFAQFADAINTAFARWDRSHLSVFTLPDGRIVTDADSGVELTESAGGPVVAALDIGTARVAGTVELGSQFQFTFDLGDNWTHRCAVGAGKVDPLEELGIRADGPLPYWGWGAIPDQYGRRWADDDGHARLPRRPSGVHPMLAGTWPHDSQPPARPPDLLEVRAAVTTRDVERLLAALNGAEIDDALQQLGAGLSVLLDTDRQRVEPLVVSVIDRLTRRGWEGDDVLAEDLLALLRGGPPAARAVAVDLDLLSNELEGDHDMSLGGFLDLRTGQVYDDADTDPAIVGEDAAIAIDDDPDRWLRIDRTGSRDGWQDMAAFAERHHDTQLRETLLRAIEGKGAFRRSRDLVAEHGLAESWRSFCTDRQHARARAFLAAEGIRVRPPSAPSS
jgi:hypothetical protein